MKTSRSKPYRNPKFAEVYNEGFTHGKNLATEHIKKIFIDKINDLENVKGIGDVTKQKFYDHFIKGME